MTDKSAESHALADMLGTKTSAGATQCLARRALHEPLASAHACVCVCVFRDETDHLGRKLDWGSWAICSDDFAYQGARVSRQAACCLLGSLRQHNPTSLECSMLDTVSLSCLRIF